MAIQTEMVVFSLTTNLSDGLHQRLDLDIIKHRRDRSHDDAQRNHVYLGDMCSVNRLTVTGRLLQLRSVLHHQLVVFQKLTTHKTVSTRPHSKPKNLQ